MGRRIRAGARVFVLCALAMSAAAQQGMATVTARLAAGDVEGALSRLDAVSSGPSEPPDLRYLRAHLLARLGRLAPALAALPDDVSGFPAPIARDARRLRARLLAATGDCSAALGELAALAGSGPHAAWARARQGECALSLGDHAAAVQALAGIDARAPGLDHFARRLHLAEARLLGGDRAAAEAELWRLWIERPDHEAVARVEALLRSVGRDPATLTIEERIARAERWQAVRQPERALEELPPAVKPLSRDERAAWLHARGMALFQTRQNYAEAARVLAQAARLGGDMEAADTFFAARALSRADQDVRAIRAYRAFARRYPKSKNVARALYLAAWLELRHGRRAGEANMRRFVRDHGKEAAELHRSALFQLAMRAHEAGRYEEAEQAFGRYAETASAAMVRGRGLYWAARAAERGGRRERALEKFRETLAVEPLHWYGLLACQRVQVLGQACGDPFGDGADTTLAAAPVTPVLPHAVAFLARLGMREEAAEYLSQSEAVVRQAAPAGRGVEALVTAYRDLGADASAYRTAVSGAQALLARRPSPATAWAWDAAYARPHQALVAALAREEGLAEPLLYAIMRKESAFDPRVVSSADAIGLMQLLPRTASRVGAELGMTIDRGQLFDPAHNLRLAARLLAGLVERFEGEEILAIAAYNAGAHRVEPWLSAARRHRRLDLDLFVEHIPFEQTRNYVRRVVGNWARYRYLADPSSGWSPELPLRVGAAADSSSRRRR